MSEINKSSYYFYLKSGTTAKIKEWFGEDAELFAWTFQDKRQAIPERDSGVSALPQLIDDEIEFQWALKKSSARSEASFFRLRDLIQDDAFEVELDLLKVMEGKYDYYLLLVNEVALVCFYTNQIPISCPDERITHLIPVGSSIYLNPFRTELENAGEMFSITKKRIREIEAKALRKMRHPQRIRQLHGFFEDGSDQPMNREQVDDKDQPMSETEDHSGPESEEYQSNSLKSWGNLKILNWYDLSLKEFEETYEALHYLKVLNINSCGYLGFSLSIRSLPKLKTILLDKCKYKSLELCDLPSLTRIQMAKVKATDNYNQKVATLFSTSNEELIIKDCPSLKYIDGLGMENDLRKIRIQNCHSLQELRLNDKERLNDVRLGEGLDKLRKIEIKDCPFLDDLSFLYDLESLREFVHDDPVVQAEVLCRSARKDQEFLESKADEWSRLIAKTKNPEHLVCNLVETLSEYATENWASEFLSSICYQLEKQEEIRGSGNEDTWDKLLAAVGKCQENRILAILEMVTEYLSDEEWRLKFLLRPLLKTLASLPESLGEWANERADELLDSLSIEFLRDYGPSVCLFYARMGRDDRLRSWLEKLTDPETPLWRDRIHLALGQWEIERGDIDGPRARLKEMSQGASKDELLGSLARALTKEKPLEAGELLDQISEEWRQASLSAELAEEAAFTEPAENAYRLLLHMERDPDKLANWVGALTRNHPQSELAKEVARTFGAQSGGEGDALRKVAERIFEHSAVRDASRKNDLESFAKNMISEPGKLDDLLSRSVLGEMIKQGVIVEDDLPEILSKINCSKQDSSDSP